MLAITASNSSGVLTSRTIAPADPRRSTPRVACGRSRGRPRRPSARGRPPRCGCGPRAAHRVRRRSTAAVGGASRKVGALASAIVGGHLLYLAANPESDAAAVGDPADVRDRLHHAVGHLHRPLVFGDVEGSHRTPTKSNPRRASRRSAAHRSRPRGHATGAQPRRERSAFSTVTPATLPAAMRRYSSHSIARSAARPSSSKRKPHPGRLASWGRAQARHILRKEL